MSKGKIEVKDWNFDFTEIHQKKSRGSKSEESNPPGYYATAPKPDDSAETGQNLVAKVCCNLVHFLYSLISPE
jgi:hypothetical protein